MKKGKKVVQRILATFVGICVMFTSVNIVTLAADPITSRIAGNYQIVTDPGTADTFETILGTDKDGNRYAGRLWVDKSVYKNGDTAVLNNTDTEGATIDVNYLTDDEAFQVIFSVLGTSMTTATSTRSMGPMDVVLVLDSSVSMTATSGGASRLQRVVEASNVLIDKLLTAGDVRLGIVSYNADSDTILELDSYTNGVTLSVSSHSFWGGGVISAIDNVTNRTLGSDEGIASGTNLQSGIDAGMKMLATAQNTQQPKRKPAVIVLTDGAANHAVTSNWYNVSAGNIREGGDAGTGVTLSTLLNAAYNKAKIEDNYGQPAVVYGVSVDLSANDSEHAIMNPASATNGFNSNNSHENISDAYGYYQQWVNGNRTISFSSNGNWSFAQLPANDTVSKADVIANINYVDHHYTVSSVELTTIFDQISTDLISGAFNPITDTIIVEGETGVKDTPLIYVDEIGRYMEVKNIQSVTLFGESYDVTDNKDGTYTVETGTGKNPTTDESWDTSRDIKISITEEADGSQKLEIKIHQEILPIILEQVESDTVGNDTTTTITELLQRPLRVYYTVGLDSDILLPNGDVDLTKIDMNYPYRDDVTGQITFYSNKFGVRNLADNSGTIINGDAHVGFQPSSENRYYYHPANQGVYTEVTRKDNVTIGWEEGEYGVRYEPDTYNFTYLKYEDYTTYQNIPNDQQVYTYVTFYRPTPDTKDAETAGEEVTYLVYTDWGYLKESIAFYDYHAKVYVNYNETSGTYETDDVGYAIPEDKVESVLGAYMNANRNADLRGMLGVGSLRTSRFHNMTIEKEENETDTAKNRYAPQYTHEQASDHHDNDVVVWLGNNGRLTTTVNTGIALTKSVTEAIGNADDRYALTVTIPAGVVANPVVTDAQGNDITSTVSTYLNQVLTVNIKAGETVYISGIPAGTTCTIGENISVDADYRIASKTDTVTIPTMAQVLAGTADQFEAATVTNTPNKTGDLFVTKEIISSENHAIPNSILEEIFEVAVDVGDTLAGDTYEAVIRDVNDETKEVKSQVTVATDGIITLTLSARETIEILGLPEGANITVTEIMTASQAKIFKEDYETRNQTGIAVDADNKISIVAGARASAVVINDYTPLSTTVDLDINGTKDYQVEEGGTLPAATFNFKVQSWDGAKWVDMTVPSASVSYNAGTSGKKYFAFDDVLKGITYTQTGAYAYQVIEEIGNVENVTYDRTLYTFTVTVADQDGQLVATVTDLDNKEITNNSYDVTFTNTYHTAPISIDIVKIVNNESGDPDMGSGAGFAFKVEGADTNWIPKAGYDPLYVYSDAAGEARLSRTYTEEGTHYYLISEVDGKKAGWTYSTAQYRVKVVVEDEQQDGNLTATMAIYGVTGTTGAKEEASVTGGDKGKVSFVNTYDPTNAIVDLDLAVRKDLQGKALEPGEFTFKVYEDGTTNALLTGTNQADGSVAFDDVLTFDKVGRYPYDIAEVEGNKDGVTYDTTTYDMVVEVSNDVATGKLIAEYYFEDAVGKVVTFKNEYEAEPTDYTITGIKTLHGRSVKAGEFTFELYEEGNTTAIDTATNMVGGAFAFDKITYDKPGTYTYTIKEADGQVAGITYTGVNTPITVIVTITDTNAVLSASAKFVKQGQPVPNVEFENLYKAQPAVVLFQGSKTLEGGTLEDDMFTFKLYETTHSFDITGLAAIDEAKNKNGAFAFDALQLDKTGTYYYVIAEDATNPLEGIVYDGAQHRFQVQVTDIGDGQLRAAMYNLDTGARIPAASNIGAQVTFTNATFDEVAKKEVYTGQGATHIDGQKVNAGDILTYRITYTNYTGKDVVANITDTIPQYTEYVEGSASHNGVRAGDGIDWILHVAKGESVTVSFSVQVEEMQAIVTNIATIHEGENTYHTNEVVNHTVEEVVKKDVFLSSDATTSVDGKMVQAGEELVYTITYINASEEEKDVTITDTIPAYTTYVEDSADHMGIYDDGVLTWELEKVPAWTKVTVSFKVIVNENAEGDTIENIAKVKDGNNEYTTNKVVSHTEEEEEKKKEESKEDTITKNGTEKEERAEKQPSSGPKTGDETSVGTWSILMTVSLLVCGLLLIIEKKRKRQV